MKRKAQTDVPAPNPAPKNSKQTTDPNEPKQRKKGLNNFTSFILIFSLFSSYKFVNKVLNPIHILLITNPYTYTHRMFSIMKITLLSDSKIRHNIVSTLFSHTLF